MTTAPLNAAQARIIDPILTNHARGYVHPGRVGHILFPNVDVPVRGFKRIEFGKESFKLYNSRRAAGAATKRVTFGYEGRPAGLYQHSLEGLVARETQQEAAAVPMIDMRREAVDGVLSILSLRREYDQAQLATDPDSYPADNKEALSGSDQWSHEDSDPKAQIREAKEQIRRRIGVKPNTLVLGPSAFLALDEHPKIVERIKYTSTENVTPALLARYFDVATVAVAEAIYADEDEDFQDVWGNHAILAYVAPSAARGARIPSFAYTYQLSGHPFVEQGYDDRNAKSWVVPVTDEFSPEILGAEAGFLFSDVAATEE